MNFPVPTTRLTPIRAAVTLPAAALLLVVVFAPVPNALRSITLRALFDFAHFSLAAAGCWFLWARFRCSGWAAFATVVAAAALCEVLQSCTGRCPSMVDFFRGFLGALVAAICLMAYRPSTRAVRWLSLSLTVVALSAWPISEFLFAAAKLCLRTTSG